MTCHKTIQKDLPKIHYQSFLVVFAAQELIECHFHHLEEFGRGLGDVHNNI